MKASYLQILQTRHLQEDSEVSRCGDAKIADFFDLSSNTWVQNFSINATVYTTVRN